MHKAWKEEEFMLRTKNIFNTFFMMAVAAICISMMGGIVKAGDVNDTKYNYYFNVNDGHKTNFREKEDATSSYMYCKSASSSYTAKVYGGHPEADAYDCSMGYRYYFETGYKRFLYNNVNESGFEEAAIFGSGSGNASGLWSPDSVYQSGVRPGTDHL